MSRWDDVNFEHFRDEKTPDYEEIRLLSKFEDYRELEKKELEKKDTKIMQSKEKTRDWTNRFIFLTIIQAFIITGFTLSLMLMEFINSEIKLTILVLVLGILTGEIVFIYKYFRKTSKVILQNDLEYSKMQSEFDII